VDYIQVPQDRSAGAYASRTAPRDLYVPPFRIQCNLFHQCFALNNHSATHISISKV
jgi:hypothetical protein